MRRGERPLLQLPGLLLVSFLLVLLIQIYLHHQNQNREIPDYRPLSKPYSASIYEALSMGSEQLLSYLLAMRLQLHDNQAGRHISYRHIDYRFLVDWLKQIQELNPESEYPMMLASRVYSQTQDKERLSVLLHYINDTYLSNPQLHWRRQAESTVIAKHQLDDIELALSMAEKLSSQPDTVVMPRWARDMHFLLLGDLNKYEAAIVIIRGLLESDSIQDGDEKRFLKEKLLYFQQRLSEYKQNG